MIDPVEIAVVITTFNSERFIGEAIESVVRQTLQPAEIVVIDNGSTDSTESMVATRNIPFYVQTDGHVGRSRNLGLQVTKSPLIKYLDGDDLLSPSALQDLWDGLSSQNGHYAYGKNTNFVDESYTVAKAKEIAHTETPVASGITLNSLMHRSVFETYGLPEEDNHSWNRWFVEATEKGMRSVLVEAVVGRRRIHDSNISHQEDAKTELFNLIAAKLQRKRLADEA